MNKFFNINELKNFNIKRNRVYFKEIYLINYNFKGDLQPGFVRKNKLISNHKWIKKQLVARKKQNLLF